MSLHGEGAADAVADEQELVDAQMVHQGQLVVSEGAPRVFHLHRAGGLAADCVALVHGDDAEVVLEHFHGVKHLAGPVLELGIQSTTWGGEKREP